MRRKLAVILASDVAGYSKLVALDEETTVLRFAKLKAAFGELVSNFHGRIFNTAGDAILAEFESATEAVRCAIEIQDTVRARNIAFPESRRILFRIGIAIGDVLVQEDSGDLLGDGVNIAARLQTLAKPGGVCVSNEVYGHVGQHLSCTVVDMGPQQLKNIGRPVHVFGIEIPGAPVSQQTVIMPGRGTRPPLPAAAPPASPAPPPAATVLAAAAPNRSAVIQPTAPVFRRSPAIIIIIGAICAAAVGLGGWFLLSGKSDPMQRKEGRSADIPATPQAPATASSKTDTPPELASVAPPTTPSPPALPAPAAPVAPAPVAPAPVAPAPVAPAPVAPAPTASLPSVLPDTRSIAIATALRQLNITANADKIAAEYLDFSAHKSFSIAPGRGYWRARGLESAQDAEAVGLEGCQINHNAPCMLLARGDDILPETDRLRREPQSMARVVYAGSFDRNMIPAISAAMRNRPDIANYADNKSPKALAISPVNARVTVAIGTAAAEAEARALADCDAKRASPTDPPCLLYASGNTVVLPQRRTAAQLVSMSQQPSAQDAATSADPSIDLIVAELRKYGLRMPPESAANVTAYFRYEDYKAIAVAQASGYWRVRRAVTAQDADTLALESCQMAHNKPCSLLVRGNAIVPESDELRRTPQSMPRVMYSGPFDPTKIPILGPALRVRQDVAGYPVLQGPKAMAIHVYGRAAVTQGANEREAEARALAACNAVVNVATEGPCRTYAINNEVVLPQRRTAAR